MSFGVSAGDFVAVSALAWKLYRACKSSAMEFQRLTSDVCNLHIVLMDLKESVEHDSTGLTPARAERLKQLNKNAWDLLRDLEVELSRYDSLSTKTQKKWDAVRFGLKDVGEIRMRIVATTAALAASESSLARYV